MDFPSLVRTDDKTFYFHCALEGKKLDILQKNPRVCLSAVTKCKPTVGPKNGSFTLEFKSAIAFGTAEIVSRTAVVRIRLTEPPVGKRKQYDSNGEEMKWQRME